MHKSRVLWISVASSIGAAYLGDHFAKRNQLPSTAKFLRRPSQDPWVLLAACKNATDDVSRWQYLEQLWVLQKHLPDWLCCELSQAASLSTIIGLALMSTRKKEQSELLSYIKPIKERLRHDDEMRLRNLLELLAKSANDYCVKFYTKWALDSQHINESGNEDGSWIWGGHQIIDNHMGEGKDLRKLLLYLQALWINSTVPSQVVAMENEKVLVTLQIVWTNLLAHIESLNKTKAQTFILKILANLALSTSIGRPFCSLGWLQLMLAEGQFNSLQLSCLRDKVLINLMSTACPVESDRYEEGIFNLADSTTQGVKPVADVVFLHGLRGGVFHSWRQRDLSKEEDKPALQRGRTRCWAKDWLSEDLNFPVRVIGVDYDSHLSNWPLRCVSSGQKNTIVARSDDIVAKLQRAGVGRNPIIWVTHSMGGLIAKQILVAIAEAEDSSDLDNILNRTVGVVFYGTPHYGSPLASNVLQAKYRYILQPSLDVVQLQENSPYLLNLNGSFRQTMKDRDVEVLSLLETIKSSSKLNRQNDFTVPERSADIGIGQLYRLGETHLNICKPNSRHSPNYRVLVDFVNELLTKVTRTP